MKFLILALKILGWVFVGFVSIKMLAVTYLGYNGGMSLGQAFSASIMGILDFDDAKDNVYFSIFILGLAFLFKSRMISKLLRSKDNAQ